MKTRLRITICIILAFTMCLCFVSCGNKTKNNSSDAELTMYIGLGNTNSEYYQNLHDAILENTGIDVKYIYSNTNDTTNAIATRIKYYDLPADIVITAQRTNEYDQINSLLDLAKYTNIPDLFKASTIANLSINGSVYQLPFTTRLIGIEYNKTLLEENGWSLPNNFEEMVALKKEVEAEGYNFAVTAGDATGHGFNYLFHIMGSQYLSSPDGTKWLTDFQNGETSIDEFAKQSGYFQKYVEAGLFGSFHNQDRHAANEFRETRALFYYNITNNVYSEDSGDEYGSMPWISENGSSNCYVRYDSMFVALDKKLAENSEKDKLDKAIKVLEFMASSKAIELFTDLFPDGYAGTMKFEIDESRLYYDYADEVKEGFIIPWYYNYFDPDTIVNVGQKANEYIASSNDTNMEDILQELDYQNKLSLEGSLDEYIDITEEFGYEDCAKLQAIANAISLEKTLNKTFDTSEMFKISASIIPYTNSIDELPLRKSCGVVQEKLYKGLFARSEAKKIINGKTQKPIAVRMTGAEIKAFVSKGYDISEDYESTAIFPYVCVIKNGIELQDNEEYYVAIPKDSMPVSVYEQLLAQDKIICISDNNPITGNMENGLNYLFDTIKTLSPKDTIW